ncbi:MAG TPA: PP2C family protein-serine/threonine phosphatase [Thermoanaerobaculia bacterium]|nr:PP2C family protein-serine/threonine phosphatase [Thermoanaerobaculia bacterium]
MALLRDWLDLGRNTFGSLRADDVTNLYSLEWPETRNILIADHRSAIERERRGLRRWTRTLSAIFFGLAKRLAPHRRILFILSQVAFFICVISIFTRMKDPPFWIFVQLTATFLVMTVLLAMELIDKIKIRDELALARELQASLIPARPPQVPGYDIAAFNRIANTVGGDIYDFVPLADGRLAVLFGDASGHGMAAGLVMAVAHAAFRTQLDVDASPAAITASLNRILCRTGGSRSFFSCCYLLLTPGGEFVATVAGHPPMLQIDAGGRVVERFGRGAYPLGVKTRMDWQELRGTLLAGHRLVLHSDGLSETRNRDGLDLGYDTVESIAGWNAGGSAGGTVENLVAEWRRFAGGASVEDDVSIAVIKRV